MRRILLSVALGAVLLSQPVLARDLLEVYGEAVKNDPQLKAAKADLEARRELNPEAKALLKPSIGLTGSANYVKQSSDTSFSTGGSSLSPAQVIVAASQGSLSSLIGRGPILGSLGQSQTVHSSGSVRTQDLSLTLAQPIYRRALWIQLHQANDLIAQASAEYLAQEQGLMFRTVQAYFNVLGARDDLEFAGAEKTSIERQLDQSKQRFEVGLIPITGVHEAQARFDSSRANEIAAQNALDNALEALREITASDEERGTLASVAQELPLKMPVPAKIKDWTEFALKQNPGVIAAQDAAEAARKDIEVQRSGHYPTLDLVGSHSISRTDSPLGTDTDASSIGLQLAFPLYAGGGVVAKTREAQFSFQAARERLEQQMRSVQRQVRDAYRGVESNISRVKALKAATVSASSALEATQAGYEVGTRTIVDVLNAESDLFNAKREYAKSRYDYIVNGIALKQAAGTLSADDLRAVNALLAEE